ncbi:MAG: 2Fe-2S iron-sulfur cluster binding domain-containing protein [Treponema sp.]|uniref:(2Fe-2S)-binding protein n=1 Tax=Treponema sp. TaxID=166 RepID=UPI001B4347EA|nr:2Fe-2S iron-sulfur cluster-binding protein [Treponema sp.]MBP5403099.1 2Fe-2S iron-sulfur cluster binding domain-containing protein [Treponema sp.]MBR5934318.1 2Fe-2S iron-sulfur cluster binding domain-containing protein [Treponema sp.]
MKIPVILNDVHTVLEADPSENLVHVLRRLGFVSVKHGCNMASCGSCQVLIDGKAVASCRIPVGIIKDCSITTLEHFSKSEIYSNIMKGFDRAGITLCGYCNAGKIFAAYEVLTTIVQPTREKIAQITDRLNDCCVEKDTFINGILYAYAIHFDREKLRKNGK